MVDNDIVSDLPSWDEATLLLSDHLLHEPFKAVGYEFGDCFIAHIAQAYGPEMSHSLWQINFGDEGDSSVVQAFWHNPLIYEVFN